MNQEAKTVLKAALATGLWCALHSLLASSGTKRKVRQALGETAYRRVYRPLYNLQSAGTLVLLGSYLRTLPDRPVFEADESAANVIRVGQAAAFSGFLWAAHSARFTRLSGAANLAASHPQDQEGQGPSLDLDGVLQTGGAFRYSRHAVNAAAVPLLWLFPRIGLKHAVFSTVSTLYLWLGSFHEEQRQQKHYGETYRRYQNSGVSFFFPRRFKR